MTERRRGRYSATIQKPRHWEIIILGGRLKDIWSFSADLRGGEGVRWKKDSGPSTGD